MSSDRLIVVARTFGENIAHRFGNDVDQLEEERLVKSKRAAVANSATKNAAQDVAAAIV